MYGDILLGSFLVPTVDSTDSEGVVCTQDFRTGVVLTGTYNYPLTRAGGGVRSDCHMIPLHNMLRVEGGGPLEGDHWIRSSRTCKTYHTIIGLWINMDYVRSSLVLKLKN